MPLCYVSKADANGGPRCFELSIYPSSGNNFNHSVRENLRLHQFIKKHSENYTQCAYIFLTYNFHYY